MRYQPDMMGSLVRAGGLPLQQAIEAKLNIAYPPDDSFYRQEWNEIPLIREVGADGVIKAGRYAPGGISFIQFPLGPGRIGKKGDKLGGPLIERTTGREINQRGPPAELRHRDGISRTIPENEFQQLLPAVQISEHLLADAVVVGIIEKRKGIGVES